MSQQSLLKRVAEVLEQSGVAYMVPARLPPQPKCYTEVTQRDHDNPAEIHTEAEEVKEEAISTNNDRRAISAGVLFLTY